MIGYLKGRVLNQNESQLLLGVGDQSFVGYNIKIPARYQLHGEIELYIHTHIREDAFELFGFPTQNEKEIFCYLLQVNGVGPKAAIGILSQMEADDLVNCILTSDRARLVKLPGVGKKTAERILLDLKEKLEKRFEKSEIQNSLKNSTQTHFDSIYVEALGALRSLGYRDHELKEILQKLFKSETRPKKLEDVIRVSLQQLG